MPEPITESEAKLQHLVEQSQRVLFTARALFPFQLIPDRIVIDETKVTVEHRNILKSEDIHTIHLPDITQVEVTYVLFLATLIIKSLRQELSVIPFLRRQDAVQAKQIITGLLAARREQINLEEVPPNILTDRLIEIGKPHA